MPVNILKGKDNENDTVEIFAIWEYDSYEDYLEIEPEPSGDISMKK